MYSNEVEMNPESHPLHCNDFTILHPASCTGGLHLVLTIWGKDFGQKYSTQYTERSFEIQVPVT